MEGFNFFHNHYACICNIAQYMMQLQCILNSFPYIIQMPYEFEVKTILPSLNTSYDFVLISTACLMGGISGKKKDR